MNGIAYDSTRFFSSCLGKALENAGIEVSWFDFQRQTMKDLEALCGQSFDAVIDYNSKLPGAVLDDGTPFLNHIQAPFYNYILDHPVYHHANLSVLLENYHVICIDDDHNKYISKWYPHIKSVHTLSVGAAKAENAVKSELQTLYQTIVNIRKKRSFHQALFRIILYPGNFHFIQLQCLQAIAHPIYTIHTYILIYLLFCASATS